MPALHKIIFIISKDGSKSPSRLISKDGSKSRTRYRTSYLLKARAGIRSYGGVGSGKGRGRIEIIDGGQIRVAIYRGVRGRLKWEVEGEGRERPARSVRADREPIE
jgi:hypothetical protein